MKAKSKCFTEAEVREQLRGMISFERNQQKLAKEIGICHSYMSDVLNGRRGIGPAICEFLGLEVCYRVEEVGRKGK